MTAPETGREISADVRDQRGAKCPKPGCGAMKIVGRPCTDWGCPQQTVTASEYQALAARLASLEAERAKTVKECARIVEVLEAGEIRFGSRDLEDGWRAGYEAAIDTAADAIRALASEKGQADG